MTHRENGIVVNTSPWIALSICGQIQILEKLYTNVFVSQKVREEIIAGGKDRFGVHEFETCQWLNVQEIHDMEKVKLLYELDQGEAQVIILAKERDVRHVLIDEKVARLQAKILGLEVIGTLGILLKAKRKGLLTSIKASIEMILSNGIWIQDEIVEGILKEAG
ncbi:MAG: DUF3368 domain-containing protein, partial [Deltaproteobacteria bacterium]|nr:DUF3368 domain-containing protein [Deltaproteobacteria bacterium]